MRSFIGICHMPFLSSALGNSPFFRALVMVVFATPHSSAASRIVTNWLSMIDTSR